MHQPIEEPDMKCRWSEVWGMCLDCGLTVQTESNCFHKEWVASCRAHLELCWTVDVFAAQKAAKELEAQRQDYMENGC